MIVTVATTGIETGSTIQRNTCHSDAPSTMPASTISAGIDRKNCSNRKNCTGPKARNRTMPA